MHSHLHIPVFIEAKTKKDLVKTMLANNVKHGGFVQYFDIQKDGASWVAWFFADLSKVNMIENNVAAEKKKTKKKVVKK